MQNGIYHVRFTSSIGSAGEGLAVVKDGSVNGGDGGYLYMGTLNSQGVDVRGELKIHRWNPGHVSVFGPLGNFALVLAGRTTSEGFTVAGSIPGQPSMGITIVGRKLADAT